MSINNNETWLLEQADSVIDRKPSGGLDDFDRAVYALWCIDYSIRNGGDLEGVQDLYPDAPSDLRSIAIRHSLEHAIRLMEQYGTQDFEEEYFASFDSVVTELKSMKG